MKTGKINLFILIIIAFVMMDNHVTQAQEKADFSKVQGNIVTYRPASGKKYIGSPGLVVLKEGVILAKCDEFGPATKEHELADSYVYKSVDHGKTWKQAAHLPGFFWASIYLINDHAYMLWNKQASW